MEKIFRQALATILIVACMMTATIVGAEIKTYDGKAQYIASEFESPEIAKKRVRQKAEKDAQMQAGVYLRTYSRSVNARITDDEISAVTNNTLEVFDVDIKAEPFEYKGEPAIMYSATIKAKIDSDGIYDYIKRDDKEKVIIVQQNTQLQETIEKNDKQIEDLKEQYRQATSQTEKDRIHEQMDVADRIFSAQQKLEEGNKLYYSKDYNSAIKLYNEALEFGEYANVYYNIGICYLNLRNYNSAIQSFEKAILLNPNYADAYNNRGVAYMDGLDKQERAIKDFDKAIALNPNNASIYYNRGNAYKKLEQYERAIKDYTKSIDLNPNDPDVYCNRGVAYSQNGQIKQSMQDFNKALALNPNDAELYSNRGVGYLRLGQYEQSIHDFDKAIAINPNYATVYSDRGTAYLKLQRYDKAIQDYDKAINLNPNSAEIYTNRGVAHAMSMNFKQAIADAMKAIQINPNYSKAYQLRGICYQQLGDNKKAQADFAKAKQLGFNG